MNGHELTWEIMQEAAKVILQAAARPPEIGIILGSGLGPMANDIENPVVIPYQDIPGCPASTAPGHTGQLILGELGGRYCMAMQGRFHYYEGHSMDRVVYLVRIMAVMGIRSMVVTNAAGGVNRAMQPGDLMLITDHIGLAGESPLRGTNFEQLGPRFNDQTHVYDPEYLQIARQAAAELSISLYEGVYFYTKGPSYETPAEIRAVGILGGDAVGMSTVPEVVCANHAGIRVLGISCITNMAAGISADALNHEDVLRIGQQASSKAVALVKAVISRM